MFRSTATNGPSAVMSAESMPRWPTARFAFSARHSIHRNWRRRSPSPATSRSTWTEKLVRYRILTTILRWLAVVLILRVLGTILANYPDYFPPNFDSLFLQGREPTFTGIYRPAFYVHIFSGPVVLFNGVILLSEYVRRRHGGLHRLLGRVQVAVLVLFVLPSSVVMSRHAFGGWPAGLSFLLLSAATAGCAIVGVVHARRRRYDQH